MNVVLIHPNAYEANCYIFSFVLKGKFNSFRQKKEEDRDKSQ